MLVSLLNLDILKVLGCRLLDLLNRLPVRLSSRACSTSGSVLPGPALPTISALLRHSVVKILLLGR